MRSNNVGSNASSGSVSSSTVSSSATSGVLPAGTLSAALTICILFVCSAIVFFPSTFSTLLREWTGNGVYNYGLVNLAMAVYFAWISRAELTASAPLKTGWLFFAFSLLAAGWLVAEMANIRTLKPLAVCLLLIVFCVYTVGFRPVLTLLVPWALLFLALPVWHPLQQLLRAITTEVTELLLIFLKQPYIRDGYLIEMPGGNFLVESGCSGLGFFMVALTLSLSFSLLNSLNRYRTIVLVATALSLAIVVNWLRVIIIVYIGNKTQMEHILVQDHLGFGWVLFVVALFPLYFVAQRIVRMGGDSAAFSGIGTRVAESLRLLERYFVRENGFHVNQRLSASVILLLLLPALAAGTRYIADANSTPEPKFLQAKLPGSVPIDVSQRFWMPVFHGASVEEFLSLGMSGHTVYLYHAGYGVQRDEEELVSEHNRLYPNHWNAEVEGEISGAGSDNAFRLQRLEYGGRVYLMAYQYQVLGRSYQRATEAKWYSALALLRLDPDARMIAMLIEVTGSDYDELAVLRSLAKKI